MSRPTIERLMNAVARTAVAAAAGVLLAAAATAQDPGWREMAEREARRAAEAQRAQLIRQRYERRRSAAHARMRSEDAGTLYASTPGPAHGQLSCPAEPTAETPSVFDRFITERADGTLLINIGDSRPTGTGRQATNSAPPYWPETLLPVLPQPGSALDFGIAHADLSITGARGDAASARTSAPQGIPFFPSASDAQGRLGIARFVNRSPQAGNVYVEAIDDSGRRYGPLTLSIAANETVHIDSGDLENGNADKGLFGGTGQGVGDWRLELSSDLDVEALSYVRSWDGLLTPMHDVAPSDATGHRVAIFNPAGNQGQESRLRLINPSSEPAYVAINGIDSLGRAPGTGVSVTIPAGASLTYTAAELESGNGAGLRGSLGDGTGEWRLVVESQQPLAVMSLLSSQTGHLTNLSTVPASETQGIHAVPLFPAASDPSGNRGLVRIVNRGGTAGEVRIEAFDDTRWDHAPLVLSIGPGEAVHFDSNDLEQGNPSKGLVGSTGPGQGDWRLELTSDIDIEVLSYVRAWDGLLTSMHDVVPSEVEGTRHRVSMFNAEGQWDRQNRLRLINPGNVPAEVSISGTSSAGTRLGGGLAVTIPAGATRTYTAAELASGDGIGLRGSLGSLGGGLAESQLVVESDRPLMAMTLLSSPTGHLTNLSTVPIRGLKAAPPVAATDDDPPATETPEDVFETLVSSIVQSKCVLCHVEGGVSGNTRLVFVPNTNEDHEALNLDVFEALVAALEEDEQVENPVTYVLNKVQGVAHGGGVQAAAGTADYGSLERFLGILGEAVAPVGITPETLFDGVTMETPRQTLRRAALVFAGRIPTDAEYAAIQGGSEDALRTTIRGLMKGPEFHEFLIRASNDRLFTDRAGTIIDAAATDEFVDFSNLYHEKAVASSHDEVWKWYGEVQHGIRRAPLELIAHVAENDLPYTEVLTADYIMANPQAAQAYGASTEFDDESDVYEFRPSAIVSYYRDGPAKVSQYSLEFGTKVTNPGDLATDYPHAGILNTTVFLLRYPTTATNRNRARSRWTYYHFLGLDIEKSAPRTTDPVALADTNNPTMLNSACTVCHSILDPVAGAFQNYGDTGLYRDQWGGLDSLDRFYKEDFVAGSGELEVTARAYQTRQTMAVEVRLPVGESVVRFYPHFDPPKPKDSEAWWNGGFGEVRVLNSSGLVVHRLDLADLVDVRRPGSDADWLCGTTRERAGVRYFEAWFCSSEFPINVEADGSYTVELDVWIHADHEVGDRHRLLSLDVGVHRAGDTWYRDMRSPGFDGQLAPNAENSLHWLAQRIVANERFAEATVKFWWPSIMGNEVAEPPEGEGDADFGGLLLASNSQSAEITRLANGFRDGFHEGSPYNVKDLLVEIVLSKWFRATELQDDDSIRASALANAGAKRLLTPEELANKTLALTGFQWGRTRGQNWRSLHARRWSALSDIEQGYGLLYGSIDSDGLTDRARDLTSVMAAVAQSHALQSSYPIVMREFFLLPDDERRLFGGADHTLSLVSELEGTFEIAAPSRTEKETVSLTGSLSAGSKNVRLAYVNDFYDDELGDRNIHVDRLRVLTASGGVVGTKEIEDAGRVQEWCEPLSDAFWLAVNCAVQISIDVPSDGEYAVEIVVWADHAGDELPKLVLTVESEDPTPSAARAIRAKLMELYDKLHGIEVTADSPEVRDAYELFVEVWERKREEYGDHFRWNEENIWIEWPTDHYFLDGIADDAWREELDEYGNELGWDWDAIGDFFDGVDWSDPQAVARTWTVVLAYLMMDYRYLYL